MVKIQVLLISQMLLFGLSLVDLLLSPLVHLPLQLLLLSETRETR